MKSRSGKPRWLGGPALLGAAATAAVLLLGACGSTSASAGGTSAGGTSGAVQVNPSSGRVSLVPTWSTSAACPAGFQGSAIFRIVRPNGTTFSLSAANNAVTAPFHGVMLAQIGLVQEVASLRNGGSAELIMLCYSGPSLTGDLRPEMHTYITISADGFNYTTSSTAPAGTEEFSRTAAGY